MADEQSGESALRLAQRATAARRRAERLATEQPSAEAGVLEEALRQMEDGLWTSFVLTLADEQTVASEECQ